MACGYLVWYQFIFIIFVLIFGGIAAGMFVFLSPNYITQNNPTTKPAIKTLKIISSNKTKRISVLTGDKLAKEKSCQVKTIRNLKKKFPSLIEDHPELNEILNHIKQGAAQASEKVEIEKKEHIRKEQEQRKQQEVYERKLKEAREKSGETSGHPPYPDNPKKQPPGYPIKVTRHSRDSHHKGIYYIPGDSQYEALDAVWWFENESEAKKNRYRRRKPPGRKPTKGS